MTHDVTQHIHDPDPPSMAKTLIVSIWNTPGINERLSELWKDHSSRQIAQILSAEFGFQVSRNSIMGRLYRSGLSVENKSEVSQNTIRSKRSNLPKLRIVRSNGNSNNLKVTQSVKTEMPKLRAIPLAPLNLSLADLPESGCRYIAGDDILYCGHPRRKDSSFCAGHHQIVWFKATDRKAR